MAQDIQKLTPEMLIPRLGEFLIQQGLINELQLQRALDYQREQSADGEHIMLGQALVDLKFLSRDTLDQAITQQILQLKTALEATNRNLEQRVRERTASLNEA